ncbi:hypothetical protein CC2G_009008 [Coprinopsis cinerea AmutBmut pab1-1]|nr:hypothetical protein CC2G_009008 [Coprinopsis cinerea AmutBmut pab1-1]
MLTFTAVSKWFLTPPRSKPPHPDDIGSKAFIKNHVNPCRTAFREQRIADLNERERHKQTKYDQFGQTRWRKLFFSRLLQHRNGVR